MTYYEYLKLCSIDGMADFIVTTHFIVTTQCENISQLQEFCQSEEYEKMKNISIEFLKREVI